MTHPMLKFIKWLTHPVVVFVGLQIVWLTMIILWVVWFLNQQESLVRLSKIIGVASVASATTGVFTLIVGCVLLAIILVGTIVLFIFTQIQSSLIDQQKAFVSSVTHELRSPLASLQLSFETLQRHKLTDQIRDKIFGMVNKDLQRLSQLVERILIAGRLDRGIVDYKNLEDEIYVSELLDHVVDQLRHLDEGLKSRTSIACDPTIRLRGSRLGLTLVLGNIFENAIKYAPRISTIKVVVELKDFELWISVEDQGIGLSKKEQRKVFKIFHRSPRAQSGAVPGTGLGLHIVRSIVEAMGGRVWAQSDGIGRGARFTIALSREAVISY